MSVTVKTAARLHFGPLSWKTPGPQFGGLGLMVRGDGLSAEVVAEKADNWSVEVAASGDRGEEAARRAEAVIGRLKIRGVAPCRVTVRKSIPPHQGLGGGTQLAGAVAAACVRADGGEVEDAGGLADLTGRGVRSWLGLHGFIGGGLMLDAGRVGDRGVLAGRVACPGLVLLAGGGPSGLSGPHEEQAFADLPAMSKEVTGRLCDLAVRGVMAGANAGNFALFADALTEFGLCAGEFFAAAQGGRFADPAWERRLVQIRSLGPAAVAQSSWGPTVAVICQTEDMIQAVRKAFPDVSWTQATAVPPRSPTVQHR